MNLSFAVQVSGYQLTLNRAVGSIFSEQCGYCCGRGPDSDKGVTYRCHGPFAEFGSCILKCGPFC